MGRASYASIGEIGPDTEDSLPEYPHTEELRRYGGWMNPYFINFGQSGLETQYPSLPALGMDMSNEEAARQDPMPIPSPPQLDTMFLAERFQQEINDGFKAWQLASLHQSLPPVSEASIAVDPQMWHPIFQKDRWFDLKSPVDITDTSLTAPHWSIDNADVFAELGICVEMANKIFAEAQCTKWLHALLLKDWDPITGTEYQSYNRRTGVEAQRFQAYGDPDAPLTQAARVRLYNETTDLADRIVWSFFDGDDPNAFGFANSRADKFTSAYTMLAKDKRTNEQFVIIRMNARILRTLLQDNNGTNNPAECLRYGEKHIARLQFAVTVCII